MAPLFFRTLFIYMILVFMLRIMGKRQVGEMELSELVTTLLLSEIAAMPIDNTEIPMLHAILPILLIFCLEVIITFCKTKINPLKRIFEGKPVLLIERGVLNQEELAKNRISINELISEFRIQGVPDISSIDYAILEQNGKLSVIQKSNKKSEGTGMPHTLIADGEIDHNTTQRLAMSDEEVIRLIHRNHLGVKDVFLLQMDDAGKTVLIEKEKKAK